MIVAGAAIEIEKKYIQEAFGIIFEHCLLSKWNMKDSIAVNFLTKNTKHTSLFQRISKVFTTFRIPPQYIPPSTLHNECATKRYLSTLIAGNLRRLMRHNAVERFSLELAEHTIEMALVEVLCIKQQYILYRFYHVFKKDELKSLITTIPSLRLVHLDYEHANWWAIAEKADSFS
ncbi:hypothetical protein ACH3XW_49095 [Acanthocheilonema viteae]